MASWRRARRVAGGVLALVALGVAGLVGFVEWRARRTWDAPYPPIAADGRPEAVAVGRRIFEQSCAGCHRPPSSERAIGKTMEDVPSALGIIASANLTQHPTAGIGARTDAELARVVRYGITHDGRRTIMGVGLSDEDLAAVLGYLRSGAPTFEPDPTPSGKTALTFLGRAVLALTLGGPPDRPASGLQAPPASEPVARGRYLAEIYDCGGCHSPGFAPDKAEGKDGFSGGFEFKDAAGQPIWSRNLTFHATGLAGRTQEDLGRALREGVTPRGEVTRPPMPRFRLLTDEELHALHAFLRSLPERPTTVPEEARAERPGLVQRGRGPEVIFQTLGCAACHGPGAPYEAQLHTARARPVEELAAWILRPEATRPGTQMPSYAGLISDEEARALAAWVRAGAPPRGPEPAAARP
ncbi:MAG: cytochrome c [Anaeromyxobacter sp.]